MIIALFIVAVFAIVSNGLWLCDATEKRIEIRGWVRENKYLESKLSSAQNELENKKPICLCAHGYNFHVNGVCSVKSLVQKSNLIMGDYRKTEVCDCKHYVGPEPLPDFYHPLELR